jgi:hypothetical protein
MSDAVTPKWEADRFRIVYDRTPGGIVNEQGQMSYSMRIPVLEVTEWVQDREKVAAGLAQELNEAATKDAEIKRLQDLVTSSEQERYRAAGVLVAKDCEMAQLREAMAEAMRHLEGEPQYHDQGMGCGLEDRGITDRYDAMQHGWEQAVERVYSENIAWAKGAMAAVLEGGAA